MNPTKARALRFLQKGASDVGFAESRSRFGHVLIPAQKILCEKALIE
jgi:hypothetical protein